MDKSLTPNSKSLSMVIAGDGINVSSKEYAIYFPNAELMQAGCKNCVWKLNGQCMHNLTKEEIFKGDSRVPDGICPEMVNFLVSLAGKDKSLNSIWEGFHIYKARLQESEDYKDYKQLEEKIRISEENFKIKGPTEKERKELDLIRMDKTAAKMWWVKLNQHVIVSTQKIMDRESKTSDASRLPGIQSTGTINFNMVDKKQLENKK